MSKRRIKLVLIFIIAFGLIIICRLAYLQVLNVNFYRKEARKQQIFSNSISSNRGDIFIQDKNGELYILATNKDSKFVFISPDQIKDKERTSNFLSEALDIERDLILEKAGQENRSYTVIKKEISEKEINEIESLREDPDFKESVYIGSKITRYYPEDNFASHIIGFLGGEQKGQYGVENFYEDYLKGEDGFVVGEKSSDGFMIFFDSESSLPVREGSDLILTIDFYVQYEAERLLQEAKEIFEIDNGQILVINPKTGEIKAAASLVSFDPNNYSSYGLETFINPIFQRLFEPGSVFKVMTMAAAIEEGKITPETTYVDEGFIKIGPDTLYNYAKRTYGECTMTEVLEKSINTGAVFAGNKLPRDVFLDYIEKFGVFEKTGIDVQGEIRSTNEELKKGYEVNFATAAFGQGIEMTPIQLVRAFSAIANEGKLIKPYLVNQIINSGEVVFNNKTEVQGQVVSQKTASKVRDMLISVIENGFSQKAKIPGYYVAGKTGTAQVTFSSLEINKSGYSEKTIQTFIGFAPAFNPEFLIMIKLDNPNTRTAEYSAIPLFRKLAEYIINYYQIPPDYKEES
jgi:stage V sporulation protein D (sporulation-specific penicillin-binding protein)